MDATLHALANLLIEAVPTIFFFVLLTFYLQRVFFKPMGRVLEERKKATEGVREIAQRAFEAADQKTAEFERALQLARAEMQKEHEALRQQWADEQTRAIAEARADADRRIEQAHRQFAEEAGHAQAELESQVERLGRQIEETLLKRRAA